jgi:hypothetical protein
MEINNLHKTLLDHQPLAHTVLEINGLRGAALGFSRSSLSALFGFHGFTHFRGHFYFSKAVLGGKRRIYRNSASCFRMTRSSTHRIMAGQNHGNGFDSRKAPCMTKRHAVAARRRKRRTMADGLEKMCRGIYQQAIPTLHSLGPQFQRTRAGAPYKSTVARIFGNANTSRLEGRVLARPHPVPLLRGEGE